MGVAGLLSQWLFKSQPDWLLPPHHFPVKIDYINFCKENWEVFSWFTNGDKAGMSSVQTRADLI